MVYCATGSPVLVVPVDMNSWSHFPVPRVGSLREGHDICPSCNARRMVQTAAHQVDHVFPKVPVRQWVLSLLKRLRYYESRLYDENHRRNAHFVYREMEQELF